MSKLFSALLICLYGAIALAAQNGASYGTNATRISMEKSPLPDSRQMEKELQQLDWKRFRSVLEAIPRLKAEVEAYGPAGWQFVQANYRYYRWRKLIDKLDAGQLRHLNELIQANKTAG